MNVAFNRDCLEAMKEFPDKFFDLAVVDPPYGDGLHAENGGGKGWFTKYNQSIQKDSDEHRNLRGRFDKYNQPLRFHGGDRWDKYLKDRPDSERTKKIIEWDIAPSQEYFDELFRVSKNQIIWGGNYFNLPPTRCFLIWKKLTISENFSMAMAEYAWTSLNGNAKVFECAPQGNKEKRFHPTQKPIELYDWTFKNFAQDGFKILDTHLGSGSSRIAAWKAGLDFWGYEIDKTYFDLQEQRFEKHSSQVNLFVDLEQTDLFAEGSDCQ